MGPLGAGGLDINSECCECLSAPRTRPVPLRRGAARSAAPCQAHGRSHLLAAPGATPQQTHRDVPWTSPRKRGDDAQSRTWSQPSALSFALEVTCGGGGRGRGTPGGYSLRKGKIM